MAVWAIADLHLAFGVPSKTMEVFGPAWHGYASKIEKNWKELVRPDDLVLIPGDICWAKDLKEAQPDLLWIDALPGTKLLLKGNHDYWWGSSAKLKATLPASIHFIYNSAFHWQDVAIGGTRLWDSEEYNFNAFIEMQENIKSVNVPTIPKEELLGEQRKIFQRELERLKLSLSQMDEQVKYRIAMTHYPPIGADLRPSLTSMILEKYRIQTCLFGHLHNIRRGTLPFGEARGIRYILTSADYLDFIPVKVI